MASRRRKGIILLLVCLCLLLTLRTFQWKGNSFLESLQHNGLAAAVNERLELQELNASHDGIDFIVQTIHHNNVNNSIIISHDAMAEDSHQLSSSSTLQAEEKDPEAIPERNGTQQRPSESCFSLNSPSWLQGPRLGNSPVSEEWIDHMMQPHLLLSQPNMDAVLDQTMCYPSGSLRNFSHHHWNASDPAQILSWEFRLLYLAIHRMLHVAAYPEYQLRRECGAIPSSQELPNGLGNFDYECPNSKFFITTVDSGAGMGAVLRHGVLPSFYMALITGRIPVLIQSVKGPGIPRLFSHPFPLASCKRHDWQCVFLPVTPCVLTLDDLRNASIVKDDAIRDLRRRGDLPYELHKARIVIHDAPVTPLGSKTQIHNKIRSKVYQAIMALLKDWSEHQQLDQDALKETEQWKVFMRVAELYRLPYSGTSEENQFRKDRTFRAAQLYLMRLNGWARQEMAQQLKETLPAVGNNRQYFGLLVRGTDKCRFESTCHSFDKYMELMLLKWQQYGTSGKVGTILLTSEDPNIFPLQRSYAQNTSFPLDIVVNEKDRPQGMGTPGGYHDPDTVMVASLTVLKLQMQVNVLVLNCCSNFHSILRDLIQEGCGADPLVKAECLNEMEDTRFRICCGTNKGGICEQIWADHRNDPTNIALMAATA